MPDEYFELKAQHPRPPAGHNRSDHHRYAGPGDAARADSDSWSRNILRKNPNNLPLNLRSGRKYSPKSSTRCSARSLGAFAERSHDIGHSGQYLQKHIRRAPRQAGADRRALQGRRPPDADHRQDRVLGRPADRRVLAHGGCASAGRIARQRHHSAPGAGRSDPVDSALRRQSARAGRPDRLPDA